MQEVRCPDLSDPSIAKILFIRHPDQAADPLPLPTWGQLRSAAANNMAEVCGFIDNRYNVHFISNTHPRPLDNFHMDEDEVKRTVERIAVANDRIIGIFHTHPGGSERPSAGDVAGWPNRDLRWRYFIATSSDVYEYDYMNQPVHPSTNFAGIHLQP